MQSILHNAFVWALAVIDHTEKVFEGANYEAAKESVEGMLGLYPYETSVMSGKARCQL